MLIERERNRLIATAETLNRLLTVAYGLRCEFKPWRDEVNIRTRGGAILDTVCVAGDTLRQLIRRVLRAADTMEKFSI